MTQTLRFRRLRFPSRHTTAKAPIDQGGWGSFVTTFLLAIILTTGPLVLGAARLWIELPLLGVVALLFLVQGVRLTRKRPLGMKRRLDVIDLTVALFVVYAIARWLTSPVEYFSRIEVMAVVACAVVFLTCRYGMLNRTRCMALLYLLVVVGLGETVFGYYLSNHLDWSPFGPSETSQLHYAPRWVGSYESPNHFACFLVMVIGAALALGSFSKLAWPLRILFFYLAAMMFIGVMCSSSLTGWIALVAAIGALVIMGIRNGTRRWWVPVSGGAALIVVLGFLFTFSAVLRPLPVVHNLDLGGKLDPSARFQLVGEAIDIAQNHPVFGAGPGTSLFLAQAHQDAGSTNSPDYLQDDFLDCLDDYGLVGVALVLFFVFAVTLKFFSPLWVDNRWQDRVLVATGFAAWAALLVHSLVDINLHIPANALVLFSLTGFALGRFREEKKKHWSTLSLTRLGRWPAAVVIVLSLIYGLVLTWTAL